MKTLDRQSLLAVATSLALAGSIGAETAGAGRAVEGLPTLPAGTTLPAQLSRTLHAGRVAPGFPLRATTTQRIPLGNQTYLPSGVVLEGKVVATAPHVLTIQFDTITFHVHSLPIATRALAAASFVAVGETGIPANGSTDRGNSSPASWTTAQVGGDQVVRSGWSGPVINGTTQTVGSADYWGVYTLPATPDAAPHALGPFSANSSGLFGFASDCALAAPDLTIRCATSRPTLRRGDVLLLEVK